MASYPRLVLALGTGTAKELCEDYYDRTCLDAYNIVCQVLMKEHETDVRIYASLIRLHFHGCFAQGCDGSLLLDNSSTIVSEKDAVPDKNSEQGFALAAEISVELSGGPSWGVLLERLDGTTANITAAMELPGPFYNLMTLEQKFNHVCLDDTDLVALSGN